MMIVGDRPFYLDESGELILQFKPALPGWLFTESSGEFEADRNGCKETFKVPESSFAFCFLGNIPVIYHNPSRSNTFGKDGTVVDRIVVWIEERKVTVIGGKLTGELADNVRKGLVSRVEVYLKN